MLNPKEYRRNKLRARLSFDDGYVERPIYSIKADTNEKEKGLSMIKLILDNFNLSIDACINYIEKETKVMIKEVNGLFNDKPKLHRDERGNLASPFRSKKKLI